MTVLPEDTFGISKILSDYRVETTFQTLGHRSTKVEISHYDSTTTLKAKLLNLIASGLPNRRKLPRSRLLARNNVWLARDPVAIASKAFDTSTS